MVIIILMAACVGTGGCVSSRNPLKDWSPCRSDAVNESVKVDYHDYIKKDLLPKNYFINESNIWFYQNGTGQHAVRIEIPADGIWLERVLIYSKNGERLRVIKYSAGHYRS